MLASLKSMAALNAKHLVKYCLPLMMPSKFPVSRYSASHEISSGGSVLETQNFVQYNWGYPASLKNALDYLFPEWNGKPAGIISYGGRGGGKAAAHLAEVTNFTL